MFFCGFLVTFFAAGSLSPVGLGSLITALFSGHLPMYGIHSHCAHKDFVTNSSYFHLLQVSSLSWASPKENIPLAERKLLDAVVPDIVFNHFMIFHDCSGATTLHPL